MKSHLAWFPILLFTISCAIGSRGVFYNEMAKAPSVEVVDDHRVVIHVNNSAVHSALSMYKIDYSVDMANKVIHIHGFHAIKKENRNRFEIQLRELEPSQLVEFDFIWVDPDGTKTSIHYFP